MPGCKYCRFFSKVKIVKGCWRWTGTLDENGYGYIYERWDPKKSQSVPIQAHRFAWSYLVGLIPYRKHVYHLCNNSDCVKPAHLAVGTRADYIVDWRSEWRRKGKTVLSANQYIERAQMKINKLVIEGSNENI